MGCQKLAYYENPVYGEKTVHAKKCASYSYFGARYYLSDISVWASVDPLAEDYPYQSPYTYCGWNPINVIDPDGMSEGNPDWAEGRDKNGNPQIYWVNGPSDVKPGDKYLGKETSEYQENGTLTNYKADGTIENGKVLLAPVSVNGFRGGGAVSRAMERSMNQGYNPNWINEFNYLVETSLWLVQMEMNVCMLSEMFTQTKPTMGSFSGNAAKTGVEGVNMTSKVVRSQSAKSNYLKSLAESGKYPKWMNQWLTKGKVPPGYNVEHIKPLSIGGEDAAANMRLNTISNHRLIHKYYHPWRR